MNDKNFLTLFIVWGIICLVLFAGTIFVVIHFVTKWW